MADVLADYPWPQAQLDEAWRTLLLSQHHDCWIVPYNRHEGLAWAEHVAHWTGGTCQASDAVIEQSLARLSGPATNAGRFFVRVFNSQAQARAEAVTVEAPGDWPQASVLDGRSRKVPSQIIEENGVRRILFAARAPSLGCATYELVAVSTKTAAGAAAREENDGCLRLDTDFYTMILDPKRGGAIKSLIAKQLRHREFVDVGSGQCFNGLRGYFGAQKDFVSTTDNSAQIELLENGPLRLRAKVSIQLASNAVTQWITLVQGEPRIDFDTRIDWQGACRLGATEPSAYSATSDKKAFYDDQYKLRALFPMSQRNCAIYKDAPFDVTKSKLENTYFDRWSQIKNNVILHWIDAFDSADGIGMALLTNHTTSYSHGPENLIGLTIQYCGMGLWGRDYIVQAPTDVHYALLPHKGDWENSGLWFEAGRWDEPLQVDVVRGKSSGDDSECSLVTIDGDGLEVTTMRVANGKILVRLFNPSTQPKTRTILYNSPVRAIERIQLSGGVMERIPIRRASGNAVKFDVSLPPFGIGTLQISPARD
jgi:alpha-mannosidase